MPAKNKIRNDYISVRAFAKQLGLKSHNSIIEAMDSGVIKKGIYVHPRNNHRKILPDIALKEWNAYHNDGEAPDGEANDSKKKRGGGKSSNSTLTEVRVQQGKVKLQMEALKLRKMKGELVEKELVYEQLFQFGRQIKDNIMVIPDRVIDEIIAAKSRTQASEILTNALADALASLADVGNIKFGKNE